MQRLLLIGPMANHLRLAPFPVAYGLGGVLHGRRLSIERALPVDRIEHEEHS